MSTAIVPYDDAVAPRGIVRYLGGGVGVDIRLEQTERRSADRQYSMRLVSAACAISARLYGVKRDGTEVDLAAIDVAPYSVGRAAVPLVRSRRPFEHVYIELTGEDLQLSLEAPQLASPARRRFPIAALLAAGTVAAAAGAGLTLALPQTPAFAVPATATAGTVAHIPYTTHGLAATSFVARVGGDSPFAGGRLVQARGEIALALPATAADKKVTVELTTAGWYGPLTHAASFSVAARAAMPSIARVGALSARRERIGGTETILASYLAVADDGHVSVLDRHGKLVARAPFTRTGTQRITLPPHAAAAALDVRLNVRRGASSASASVSLPAAAVATVPRRVATAQVAAAAVAPAVSTVAAAPSNDDVPEAVTPANDGSVAADDPFVIVGQPAAGQRMTVSIRRNLPAMQLRLEDETGTVLDQVNVGAADRTVMLRVPGATMTRTYYVTCMYGAEGGQEVVVRSVRVPAL
jgi:hypothetical protein